MPRLSEMEGAPVRDVRGRRAGRVAHVLFHAYEPRPVGIELERPRLLYVVPRPPAYVPVTALAVEGGEFRLTRAVPSRAAGEREIGHTWDDSVIWRGMPARSSSGGRLGVVRDARLSVKTARLVEVELTEGTVADAAVGRRTVAAENVEGFDGSAVVVTQTATEEGVPGGLAARAGTGAAYAKVGAEQLASKAAVSAAAAARLVRRSEAGRRAGRFLGALKKSVLDAMRDDEEE
ncbi:MAG: hypothetical protein IBX62_04170 [Coriobacteriia bacterium]|nr:hypothetical protein [Coriobacteriia bacterium]